MTTTAEVMAGFLKKKGVDRIFGIPGAGSSTSLMEAAEAVGIETILTGHETSAAIIASVYGEIKGIPGVCFSIPGPGATNMTTGVAYAYLERAPLLAITERQSFRNYEGIYSQRIDQAMEAAVSDGGLCLIEAVLDPETYGDHLKLIRG